MKPDRSNYEILLIDYLDGTLDNDQAEQLMRFLEENPDIKEEISDIVTYNLKPDSGSFKNKNSLKRSLSDLSDTQFEYLCISAVENGLSAPQKDELETIIAENPGKRRVIDLYRKTVIVAPDVKFRHKSALRKLTLTQKIIRLSAIGLSAAAGIALFVILFGLPEKKTEIIAPLASAVNRNDSTASTDGAGTSYLPLVNMNTGAEKVLPKEETEAEKQPSKNADVAADNLPGKEQVMTEKLPARVEVEKGELPSPEEFEKLNISKLGFKQDVSVTDYISWNEAVVNTPGLLPAIGAEKPEYHHFIAKLFREKILKNTTTESGSLKPYEIADAGIIGLNKLFGWQMSLKQNRNNKGELTSLYFSSRIIKFNAPVKKML